MIIEAPVNTPEAWSARADMCASAAEACGWSAQSQRKRFAAVLARLQPVPGETLLDYGCGTGELAELVPAGVEYVGYDWASGMLVRAQRDHPGHRFQDWEPLGSVDVIACVGAFNLPGNWSKERTWHMARHLWDGCRRALCLSLYAGDDPACLSYSEEDARRHLEGLSWRVAVERWRPNDIVVTVQR